MSHEARILLEGVIEDKEAQLVDTIKKKDAAWRSHRARSDEAKAIEEELKGLRQALDALGGPVETDQPVDEA